MKNMARKNRRIAIGTAIMIATLMSACSGGSGPKEYAPAGFDLVVATDT